MSRYTDPQSLSSMIDEGGIECRDDVDIVVVHTNNLRYLQEWMPFVDLWNMFLHLCAWGCREGIRLQAPGALLPFYRQFSFKNVMLEH